MSVMQRPPVLPVRDVTPAQVLGFRHGHDRFFAQVRAAQTSALNRHVPFNVTVMVINTLAVALLFGVQGGNPWPWLAGIGGLGLLWVTRFVKSRRTGDAAETPIRDFWMVTAEVSGFAVFWTGLMAQTMPGLPASAQAALMMESMLAMGAAGFCVAVMPVAAMITALTIGVGTLLLLPPGSAIDVPMVWLAMATYILVIVRGSLVTTSAMFARMRTQTQLSEQGEVVRLLLNEFEANGSDWLLELDAGGRLTHVTQRFADVARRPREALLGLPLGELIRQDPGATGPAALAQAVMARTAFRDLVVPVEVAGEMRWWALSGTPKADALGQFTGFRGVGRDITEVRRSQERIAHMARFDPLTGLVNRALFREMLDDTVARAVRTGEPCALLFVDLDRFKEVNDTHGHAAGDSLLRAVASRLEVAARGGATIARLGGDEFAVLIPDAAAGRADQLAARIVRALAKPFVLPGRPNSGITIGASVGLALAPGDADTAESLLRCADLALYQVKQNGRGAACRFAPEFQTQAEERRTLATDLAQALPKGQLALAFQPVVETAAERIVGFEALLRWHHPELGVVPPLRFIPIAEESGMIVPIGHWVIDEALAWAARWPDDIRVAVNLSPAQVSDPGLVRHVEAMLARHGVAADRLELEITESLFLEEKPAVQDNLLALRALGVRFALDDFGTGYSSFGTLHKAAFSRIKIDRSFVARAGQAGNDAAAIIQAIVRLARSLDMTTTAEGTETRAEFELCRDLGCADVQGWLFGKPMPPEEATALVAERGLVAAE